MMKNLLFVSLLAISRIALLLFSLNSFGQILPTLSYGYLTHRDSMLKFESALEKWRLSGMSSEEKIILKVTPQTIGLLSQVQVVDSVYMWEWDPGLVSWVVAGRTIDIVYDPDYNPTSYTGQVWDGLTWLNTSQINLTYDNAKNLIQEVTKEWNDGWKVKSNTTYTYDSAKNLTSQASQYWDVDGWINDYKVIYEYDTMRNVTSRISQNGSGMNWINSSQDLYTYDSLGSLTLEVASSRDGEDWVPKDQVIYSYDSTHHLMSVLEQERGVNDWVHERITLHSYDDRDSLIHSIFKDYDAGGWENSWQTFYTYDVDLRQNTQTHQRWITGGWENFFAQIETYDDNKRVVERRNQGWENEMWENSTLTLYAYDDNNHLTNQSLYSWNEGSWVKRGQSSIGYDSEDFLSYHCNKFYNADGVTIDFGDSTHIYYHLVKVANKILPPDDLVSIFPNPNTGQFTVRGESLEALRVYNPLGQLVYTHSRLIGAEAEIYLPDAAPGLYTVQVLNGEEMVVRQLVIY